MSKLDEILMFNQPNSWSSEEEKAKKEIKKLIFDLFKEAEYEPYKFVEKVEAL